MTTTIESIDQSTVAAGAPLVPTVEFIVDVVSGDGLPVAWIDVAARFAGPSMPTEHLRARADADGRAVFEIRKDHSYREVELIVAGQRFATTDIARGSTIVEL